MRLQLKQIEDGANLLEQLNFIKDNLKGKIYYKDGSLILKVPLTTEADHTSEFATKEYIDGIISELKGGVVTDGNSLNKLYTILQNKADIDTSDVLIQTEVAAPEGNPVSYLVLSGLTIKQNITTGQKIGTFTFNGETISFFVDFVGYAPLNSPDLKGTPTSTTPPVTDTNKDRIATTGYIDSYFMNLTNTVPELLQNLQTIKDWLTENEASVGDIMTTMATKLDKASVWYDASHKTGSILGTLYINNVPNYIRADLHSFAPINAPVFTGYPRVAATLSSLPKGSNNRILATTAFVQQEIADLMEKSSGALQSMRELLDALLDDDGVTIESILSVVGEKVDKHGDTISGDLDITGKLTVNGLITGSIETAVSAETAEKDQDGRVISETYAPIDSPTFTGTPRLKDSPKTADESKLIATTEYVINTIKQLLQGNLTEGWTLSDIVSAINGQKDFHKQVNDKISGRQPLHAALTSICNLTTSSDKMIYTTAANKYATTDLTEFARKNVLNQTSHQGIRSSIRTLGTKTAALEEISGNDSSTKIATAEQSEDYKALNSFKADISYRCKGLADTATALEEPRMISGQVFDGTQHVSNFTICTTAANTATKTLKIDNLVITEGTRITVMFKYGNTAANPKFRISSTTGLSKQTIDSIKASYKKTILDIDNLLVSSGIAAAVTTAYPVKYRGLPVIQKAIVAGSVYDFVFAENAWNLVGSILWDDDSSSIYTQSGNESISWQPSSKISETYLSKTSHDYVKVISAQAGNIAVTYGDDDKKSFSVEPFATTSEPSRIRDRIWFDSQNEVIKYCTGSSWQTFGATYK